MIFFPFLLLLLFSERKEDETDEKWMEKERERAAKEREREERGKETHMGFFFLLFAPPCVILSKQRECLMNPSGKVLTMMLSPLSHI